MDAKPWRVQGGGYQKKRGKGDNFWEDQTWLNWIYLGGEVTPNSEKDSKGDTVVRVPQQVWREKSVRKKGGKKRDSLGRRKMTSSLEQA